MCRALIWVVGFLAQSGHLQLSRLSIGALAVANHSQRVVPRLHADDARVSWSTKNPLLPLRVVIRVDHGRELASSELCEITQVPATSLLRVASRVNKKINAR